MIKNRIRITVVTSPVNCNSLIRVKWRMMYSEIIADNLRKPNGWGSASAVDPCGRTIWIADAHRGDGKRYVVHVDEMLTAFVELERVPRESLRFQMPNDSAQSSPCSLLIAFPSQGQELDCKMQPKYS